MKVKTQKSYITKKKKLVHQAVNIEEEHKRTLEISKAESLETIVEDS